MKTIPLFIAGSPILAIGAGMVIGRFIVWLFATALAVALVSSLCFSAILAELWERGTRWLLAALVIVGFSGCAFIERAAIDPQNAAERAIQRHYIDQISPLHP